MARALESALFDEEGKRRRRSDTIKRLGAAARRLVRRCWQSQGDPDEDIQRFIEFFSGSAQDLRWAPSCAPVSHVEMFRHVRVIAEKAAREGLAPTHDQLAELTYRMAKHHKLTDGRSVTDYQTVIRAFTQHVPLEEWLAPDCFAG
jgi:hypothetical protein